MLAPAWGKVEIICWLEVAAGVLLVSTIMLPIKFLVCDARGEV